jgi:hypothetical protein
MRLLLMAGVLVWAGSTLLLSQWSRLVRPSLEERLRPYSPGGRAAKPGGVFSVESVRDLITPMLRAGGDRLAAAFGAAEPASIRLRRIHSSVDPSAFRLRQFTISGAALLVGVTVAVATGLPPSVSIFVAVGAPLLTFLVIEQRLSLLSQRWQRDVAYEMPVVSEQVAMLLNSGYSVGAALARIASRGRGCVASDVAAVVNRMRQGLSESEALREWAELARVEAVDRMVSVLTLHSEAADLGRLVSSEARQARRDLHRRTVETIERRAQQVWIPVTVATLVPGAILLAVPFLSALRLFSNA